MTEDKHLECVADYCGNYLSHGAWADLWERPDGSRYVSLGGGWEFYAPNAPQIIEASDPLFAGFIQACEDDEFLDFVAKNYP